MQCVFHLRGLLIAQYCHYVTNTIVFGERG